MAKSPTINGTGCLRSSEKPTVGGIQAAATEQSVGKAVDRLSDLSGPLAWESKSCHDTSCSSLPRHV